MRYSTIAGAALLTPAAFASPLNARQAPAPTCNPNNVRALGQQKPKSTGFCTNWFKTTTTKHVAPVTVTGLSEAQITNLCSCILAPSYVSGRPLTSLEPTSTQGPSSTTTSSSSASATPTGTGCVNGDTPVASDGAIFTKYCGSALDGAIGQSFSVGSTALCQAKCSDDTCKGFVYTAASRNCVLYNSVDGPYTNDGSVALVYKSGRGSSSSSSSSSTSASSTSASSSSSSAQTTSSAPVVAPSVFNIYIANSAGATASGSLLRYPASTLAAGIYPSPTANVAAKRQAAACTNEDASANGNTYTKVCDSAFDSSAVELAPTADEQPDQEDNITTFTSCISFCSKKGLNSDGKQKCKAVKFTPANTGSYNACRLYSSVTVSSTGIVANSAVANTPSSSIAYLIGDVPAGIFTIDSSTGYIYNNDTSLSAQQLCAQPDASGSGAATIQAGSVLNGKLSGTCVPLVCAVDSQLRLTCKYTNGGIIYDKAALNPTAALDTTGKAQIQALKFVTGASSSVGLYIAAPIASTATAPVLSNGGEKILLTTSDYVNSAAVVSDKTAASINLSAAGNLNETFTLTAPTTAAPTTSASVTLRKDAFVYSGDKWRFTASINLDNGRLFSGAKCTAAFTTDGSDGSTQSVALDTTFPSSFDLLFEGTFKLTRTAATTFAVTCQTTTDAITIPITISNVKFVNNPSLPANVEVTGSTTTNDRKAYVQFYSGSGSLIPAGQTVGTTTYAVVTGNTVGTTSILYVGQSTSNQAAAIKQCAGKVTTQKMFEVYYDTSDSFWKCVTFTSSLPSKSLFTTPFAPAFANANPVYGYYLSTIV